MTEQTNNTGTYTPGTNNKQTNNHQSSTFFTLFLFLIIIAAAIGAAAFFALPLINESQKQQATISKQVQTNQTTTDNRLRRLQSEYKEDSLQLQNKINELQHRVLKLSSSQNTQWSLSEATYLAKLAHQRLALTNDTQGAFRLLEASNSILKNIDHPQTITVRKQLSDDILKLKAADQLDPEGLYLKLHSLKSHILTLNLSKPDLNIEKRRLAYLESKNTQTHKDSEPNNEASIGKSSFEKNIDKLLSFVIIQKHSTNVQPLWNSEQSLFFKEQLISQITHAQLALLQGYPEVYQQSLHSCAEYIQQQIALPGEQQDLLLDEINELLEKDTEIISPDISASLEAVQELLRTIIKEQNKASEHPVVTPNNADETIKKQQTNSNKSIRESQPVIETKAQSVTNLSEKKVHNSNSATKAGVNTL